MFTTAQPRAVRTLTPALLTAIAYVDPGNFGVNMTAGAGYGYALVWVVVAASVAAALIQYLAAKLGVATGKSLALLSAERSSPVLRWVGWLQAELVVIMTDLAELVGGAIALHLLLGLPLQVGAVIVAAFSFLVLGLRVRGIRLFEVVVLTLLGVIVVAMAVQLIFLGTHPTTELAGRVGQPVDDGIVLLAVGIVGATVMPHALHFHSAMSAPDGSTSGQPGTPGLVTPRIRRSVVVALSLAGLTNVSIVLVGARLPQAAADGLEPAHGLLAAIGQVAGVAFALALLASGLASTIVGAFTGQVVLQGYLRRPVSIWVRRGIGVVVPLVVLIAGLDPTRALVISQVVLSFALPGTLVPLVVLTARPAVMGPWVNRRATTVVVGVIAALIIAMDAFLLVVTFG